MAEIRWICMSDTHFGAENSILSHVSESSSIVQPETPSGVLTQLVECLRAVGDLRGGAYGDWRDHCAPSSAG